MLATAAANSIVASRITRRGPYLSNMGPIIGEMLNASPMTQDSRRTGAYPMVQPLLARVAPGSVLPHTVSIRFGADDDCDEGKSAAYTTDVQTNTAQASVSDRRGCHRCRMYASEPDAVSTLRRRGASLSNLR